MGRQVGTNALEHIECCKHDHFLSLRLDNILKWVWPRNGRHSKEHKIHSLVNVKSKRNEAEDYECISASRTDLTLSVSLEVPAI